MSPEFRNSSEFPAISIRTGKRPERVILQPGTRHLPFRFADDAVKVTLPRLDIHEIVVIEQAS